MKKKTHFPSLREKWFSLNPSRPRLPVTYACSAVLQCFQTCGILRQYFARISDFGASDLFAPGICLASSEVCAIGALNRYLRGAASTQRSTCYNTFRNTFRL